MNIMKNNYFNEYILKYLVIFVPFFLISGPFLPDLAVVILSIFAIFSFKEIKIKENIYLYKFFIIFFIFYFIINFSSLIALKEIIISSFKVSLPYIRYILFVIAVYYIYSKDKNLINLISKSVILLIFLLFCDALIQKTFGKNILGFEISDTDRVSSFFGDELILGGFVAKLYPLGLIYFFNKKKDLYLFIYLFFVFTLIFLSQERVALVLFLLGIFIMFIIFKQFRMGLVISSLIFVFLIPSLYLINKETVFRIANVTYFQLFLNKGSIPFFSYEHQNHFKTALNLTKDKPLFGHGIKSFRKLCSKDQYSVKQDIINDHILKSEYEDQLIVSQNKIWKDWKNVTLKESRFSYSYSSRDKSYFNHNDYVKKGDTLVIYRVDKEDGCSTHPHNYLFQLLSETGVFSFIIFIICFICNLFLLVRLLKNKNQFKNANYLLILHLMIFVNFFPLLPTGSFYNNWLSILNFYPIGFLFAEYRFK